MASTRQRSRPGTIVVRKTDVTSDSIPTRPPGSTLPKGKRRQGDSHFAVLKAYAASKQIPDPFKSIYNQPIQGSALSILEPPYNPYALIRLPYENSTLGQCIESMVTNVHGHGAVYDYIGPDGEQSSEAALAEKLTLSNMLEYPNDEYGLREFRDRIGRDYETLGYCYIEVVRDKKGDIVSFYHTPAQTVRLTTKDPEHTPCKVILPRGTKTITQTVKKQFRRFVQIVGNQRRWFKEYGDPRRIDPSSGIVNDTLSADDAATEIIQITQYNPGSPYGMPRWFNQLPAVLGSRQAELTNLEFFNDNAIPAMVVLVSGGMVTQSSLDAIEDHLTSARGRQSMNRVLIIEAEGNESAANPVSGVIPAPRLDFKPLQQERQGDANFREYEMDNRDKIRSSFRLPPLFIGVAQDMTFASASTSYDVAETQVFAPERKKFDLIICMNVLSGIPTTYWRYRAESPKLANPDALVNALTAFNGVGALTPNSAIALANQFFDLNVKRIEESWGDYPFPLVMSAFQAFRLKLDKLENSTPPAHTGTSPGANVAGNNGDQPSETATPAASAASVQAKKYRRL